MKTKENLKKIVVEIPCQLDDKKIEEKIYSLQLAIQSSLRVCHACGKPLKYNEKGYCYDCLHPETCTVCGGKSSKSLHGEKYSVCSACNKGTVFVKEQILILLCRKCGSINIVKPFTEDMLGFSSEQTENVGTEMSAQVKYYNYQTACINCNEQLIITEKIAQTSYGKPDLFSKIAVIVIAPKLERKPEKDTSVCYGCPQLFSLTDEPIRGLKQND